MRTNKQESIASIKHDLIKSKKIGNNTFEVVYKNGHRAIRLHKTDIVTFTANRIFLNTNGWETVTTKARMNEYLPTSHSSHLQKPARVFQRKHQWYVDTPDGEVPYYDNMMLDYEGYHCAVSGHYNP